jgi:RNA polymerase sigma-70 factor (ECF subfamily)
MGSPSAWNTPAGSRHYTRAYTEKMEDDVLDIAVDEAAAPPAATDRLVENHRVFLRFLERRLGSREAAEDVLQEAFVRTAGRRDEIPDEALLPWFYRVLRNAVVDRHRRGRTESRALATLARELADAAEPPPDVHAEICACVGRLTATLKPEYAEAIAAVDVAGTPVKAFADAAGLTASNAGVRLFRARAALRRQVVASCGTCAEHGCRDCSCGTTRVAAV